MLHFPLVIYIHALWYTVTVSSIQSDNGSHAKQRRLGRLKQKTESIDYIYTERAYKEMSDMFENELRLAQKVILKVLRSK